MFNTPIRSLRGRLCLITGAASGIGRATATIAAAHGARLVLIDIDAEALAAISGRLGNSVVLARALDVTDLEAVRRLAAEVHAQHGPADVVMNIAGIATWGPVEALTDEQWRHTVEVNLMGPIHVIECFLAPMIEAGRPGQLVNVASAAGLMGLPWHAPYSAGKFGLAGISEVLRFDLAAKRIGVTLVCPGAVDTGLVETVDITGVPHAARGEMTTRFRQIAVTPEHAAQRILSGVTHNRFLVFTSPDIRALYLLKRLAPWLYAALMSLANRVFQRRLASAVRQHGQQQP